jgi:hypothetical protein
MNSDRSSYAPPAGYCLKIVSLTGAEKWCMAAITPSTNHLIANVFALSLVGASINIRVPNSFFHTTSGL